MFSKEVLTTVGLSVVAFAVVLVIRDNMANGFAFKKKI